MHTAPDAEIEITSWKLGAYDFYSQVKKYQKTYKALSMMLFVYFIGSEIYLRIFVRRKLGLATSVERNTNDKISLVKKRRLSNQQRER